MENMHRQRAMAHQARGEWTQAARHWFDALLSYPAYRTSQLASEERSELLEQALRAEEIGRK